MPTIEIPAPIITTDYDSVGKWPDIRYVGQVLVDGYEVFRGPVSDDSREAESDALYQFSIRLREVLNG